ncbi:MAG TPA: hypothetical protein VGG41_10670 [Solirubrobacteraceae bacterium]
MGRTQTVAGAQGAGAAITRRKAQMAEQAYEMGLEIRREGTLGSERDRAAVASADGRTRQFAGHLLARLPQPVSA